MKQLPFLLCGSPGSGKKNITRFCNYKDVHTVDSVRPRGNQQQPGRPHGQAATTCKNIDNTDLYGNILIFALFGAEHLNDAEAKFLSDKKAILVANDRTATLSTVYGKKTLWVPTMSNDKMIKKSTAIAAYCCSKLYKRVRANCSGRSTKSSNTHQFL